MSIAVGSKVRVRPGVDPWYGWNGVKPSSVGTVTHIKADGDCCVRFKECRRWLGRASQLEPADQALRPGGVPVRCEARVEDDFEFPLDGWVANPIRPNGSADERAVFDGLSRMFTPTQPQHLHQGRDVREDCPPYNGIRTVAVWQITSESRNNLYCMHQQALKKRLLRVLADGFIELKPERTKLTQFCSALPLKLDRSVNEVLLLHGTKPESVHNIMTHGLNERLCSGIFGHGTYLAEDVEKIDQYTEVDEELHIRGEHRELHARLFGDKVRHPGSIYYAFVCRTTLGHAVHTRDGRFSVENGDVWASGPDEDIHELACIPGARPRERHHALVAELGSRISRFREFVVYHAQAQILPEFLVAYHRTQDGVPIGAGYQKCCQAEPQSSGTRLRSSTSSKELKSSPRASQSQSAREPHRDSRRKEHATSTKAQAAVARPREEDRQESVGELIRGSRDASMVLAGEGARNGHQQYLPAPLEAAQAQAAGSPKAQRPGQQVPQPQRASPKAQRFRVPLHDGGGGGFGGGDEDFARRFAEALAEGRAAAVRLGAEEWRGEASPETSAELDSLLDELRAALPLPVGAGGGLRRR